MSRPTAPVRSDPGAARRFAPPGLRRTRREFLRLAGSSAALAALANLRALPVAAADASAGDSFFSADARAILGPLVERMVGAGEPGAPAVGATRALDAIDALCHSLDPGVTAPLPLLLRLVEWGPLLFELRASRFTRLGAAAQEAHLRGWMTSRFQTRRLGFQALRNLAFLGYYSQPETWPAIGYAGPLLAPPGAAP